MKTGLIAQIYEGVIRLVIKLRKLFGDKEVIATQEVISSAQEDLKTLIGLTNEELEYLREAFKRISKSHIAIIDDAFKTLRIHFTLATLKAAKPLKVITFVSIYLTNLKTSFRMWPKPKGCAYPNLSNSAA